MTAVTCWGCGRVIGKSGSGRPAKHCPHCSGPSYDTSEYREERASWRTRIEAGDPVLCVAISCRKESRVIRPGDPWDLGHDDHGMVRGPEHRACNRSAGARAGNAARAGNDPPYEPWTTTTRW
jgi:hypothetical protein